MTRLYRILLIVLMFALPMQGAMAASRSLCVAAAQGDGVATTIALDHAAAMAGEHHAHGHGAAHAAVEAASPAPSDDAQSVPHAATDACQLCAACGVTAATPPVPLQLATAAAAQSVFQPIFVPVPHNVADGPERPPRTI